MSSLVSVSREKCYHVSRNKHWEVFFRTSCLQNSVESSHRQNANSSETLIYVGTWKAAFDALTCVVSLPVNFRRVGIFLLVFVS